MNQLEKTTDEFTEYWKWRSAKPGASANGLEEGEAGPRVLSKVEMATQEDWKFDTHKVNGGLNGKIAALKVY